MTVQFIWLAPHQYFMQCKNILCWLVSNSITFDILDYAYYWPMAVHNKNAPG